MRVSCSPLWPGKWLEWEAETTCLRVLKLEQDLSDTDQRDEAAYNGRQGRDIVQENRAQEHAQRDFLGRDQIGVGRVYCADCSVVEGVAESEREKAQGQDRADRRERILLMMEAKQECYWEQPQCGEAVDVRRVAK